MEHHLFVYVPCLSKLIVLSSLFIIFFSPFVLIVIYKLAKEKNIYIYTGQNLTNKKMYLMSYLGF